MRALNVLYYGLLALVGHTAWKAGEMHAMLDIVPPGCVQEGPPWEGYEDFGKVRGGLVSTTGDKRHLRFLMNMRDEIQAKADAIASGEADINLCPPGAVRPAAGGPGVTMIWRPTIHRGAMTGDLSPAVVRV